MNIISQKLSNNKVKIFTLLLIILFSTSIFIFYGNKNISIKFNKNISNKYLISNKIIADKYRKEKEIINEYLDLPENEKEIILNNFYTDIGFNLNYDKIQYFENNKLLPISVDKFYPINPTGTLLCNEMKKDCIIYFGEKYLLRLRGEVNLLENNLIKIEDNVFSRTIKDGHFGRKFYDILEKQPFIYFKYSLDSEKKIDEIKIES